MPKDHLDFVDVATEQSHLAAAGGDLQKDSTDAQRSDSVGAAPAWGDELLTTDEAAAYLRLARSTLNKLRVLGTGPEFVRFGRSVRYELRDLEAWRRARRAKSTSDADERLPRRLADDFHD